MEFKKLGSILLLTAFFISQTSCYAILDKKTKNLKTENKAEYINLDFWNKYNDDNLRFFVLKAVDTNYDLKIAAENAKIYNELVKIQRSAQLPTVGAGFAPSRVKMTGKTDFDWTFAAPIYVNYEADIFLKNLDKKRSAKKDYEISLLDEKSAYISVASMTGTLYFNIIKLDKAISLQEDIVNLRKKTYDLMLLSNEAGIISTQDVIRANKSYIQGGIDLVNLKKQRLQLVDALAVITGTSPSETNDFKYSDIEEITYTGNIPETISSEAITHRPDYLKAEKTIEREGLNVRVAKKEFLPTINLTAFSLFNAKDLGSIFTTRSALMGLTGFLAADLFMGGRKLANLRINKHKYQIALQNYEKTNLIALQEINDALIAISHDKTKFEESNKQNALEEKDYKLRELKYNEGIISQLDLIQSKENLLVTKKIVLFEKANCFIDYISLYKALGAQNF